MMLKLSLQGGAASKDRSACVAHNHEVVGSNPTPATNFRAVGQPVGDKLKTTINDASRTETAPYDITTTRGVQDSESQGLEQGRCTPPKGLGWTPNKPLMRKVNAIESESRTGTAPVNLFKRLRNAVAIVPALARDHMPRIPSRRKVPWELHVVVLSGLASTQPPARSFFVFRSLRNRRAHRLAHWLAVSPQFGRYA